MTFRRVITVVSVLTASAMLSLIVAEAAVLWSPVRYSSWKSYLSKPVPTGTQKNDQDAPATLGRIRLAAAIATGGIEHKSNTSEWIAGREGWGVDTSQYHVVTWTDDAASMTPKNRYYDQIRGGWPMRCLSAESLDQRGWRDASPAPKWLRPRARFNLIIMGHPALDPVHPVPLARTVIVSGLVVCTLFYSVVIALFAVLLGRSYAWLGLRTNPT